MQNQDVKIKIDHYANCGYRCRWFRKNTVEAILELSLQININDVLNQVSQLTNSPLFKEGGSRSEAGWRKKS